MIRLLGAILIVTGCGTIGFIIANRVLYEISATKNLISIMEYWKNSLSFHHTTLPDLCKVAHSMDSTVIGEFFGLLGEQFDKQGMGNAASCIESALSISSDVPSHCRKLIEQLGRGLGEFDLNSQTRMLDFVLEEANITLQSLSENLIVRLRSYRTLGICTGFAIAISMI